MAAAISSANNGDTIKLTGSINTNIVLNKLVHIDLNGQTLTGNVNINSTTAGTLNISSGTITGNLIVNAPNATVNNAASVTPPGVITITDVAVGTWNENTDGNTIIVNDSTGITLNIGEGKTVASLTLNQPTTVTVGTGATVTALTVKSGAVNSTITNDGTITTLEANADVTIGGNNTPETVSGNGNLSGNKILAAPVEGLTTADVAGVTTAGAKFLVYGLNESEVSQKQKPSTLAEIKDFMFTKYGVKFNTDAIKVTNGKIEIVGSILNTADWNKVKTNGDKLNPYRITLLQDNSTNKVIKIAMYQDGKAVFNNVDNSLYTDK